MSHTHKQKPTPLANTTLALFAMRRVQADAKATSVAVLAALNHEMLALFAKTSPALLLASARSVVAAVGRVGIRENEKASDGGDERKRVQNDEREPRPAARLRNVQRVAPAILRHDEEKDDVKGDAEAGDKAPASDLSRVEIMKPSSNANVDEILAPASGRALQREAPLPTATRREGRGEAAAEESTRLAPGLLG